MRSLFAPILMAAEQLNPNFVDLLDEARLGTRRALDDAFQSFPEQSEEFVKGFQAHGFHAGVWELYLSQSLQEAGYSVVRTNDRPDFQAEKDGRRLFVEATTSNPSFGEGRGPDLRRLLTEGPPNAEELNEHRDNYLHKLARVLERKLQKNYGALPWVQGHPVVLAVSPFHDEYALLRSDVLALQYVYGVEPITIVGPSGSVERALSPIGKRTVKGRTIEFGLFNRADARWVSAIVFSNSGTIAKFDRYAAIRELHHPSIKAVFRVGVCFDPDPTAFEPRYFGYQVGKEGPDENWAQGLTVMHNPNAEHPLGDLFADVMEHRITRSGEFGHTMPYFHPYWSVTQLLRSVPEETAQPVGAAEHRC